MKLKKTLKVWLILLLFGFTFVTGNFAVSAQTPGGGGAPSTGSPNAAIVADTYDLTGKKVTDNSSVQCKAVIHKPTVVNTGAGSINGGDFQFPSFASGNAIRGVPSGDAQKTITAVTSGQQAIEITFDTSGNSNGSNACKGSMALVQSINKNDSTTFYGGYNTGHLSDLVSNSFAAPDLTFVQAIVDPSDSGVVYFTLGGSRAGSYQMALTGDTGVLANSGYFPTGGGGSTSSGSCFESAANDSALKSCIQQSPSASFTDVATVVYAGEIYTATSWGGSNGQSVIKYQLTSPIDSGRTASGKTPELDLSTVGNDGAANSLDINMDNKGSGSDLNQLAASIKRASASNFVNLKFTNYDVNGNASAGTVKAGLGGINVWAGYFPSNDTVELLFPTGGDNEKPYIGAYTRAASCPSGTTGICYVLSDSGLSGCQTSKPMFVFASEEDPHKLSAKNDGVVGVNWRLPESDNGCTYHNIPVISYIEAGNATPPVAPGSTATADNQPTCESSGFSLSWIMCPIINGLANAVDGVYGNIIKPLLVTSPIATSPSNDPKSMDIYQIWSNFRIYGDIFLVIALLVVVFGQSIGGGMIDAYTAKKVLPRLLISAILINLSIYIVALLVDITNIVGTGIQTLMSQPFADAKDFSLTLSGGASGTLAVGGAVGIAALVGGIWGLAAHTTATLAVLGPVIQFLLLFILLPAFLTMLAIMGTVLIRRGLILLLVIISPVAFALYCLPNTEQYFRKWWDLLFKTLLVYPIIAAIFGVANILSYTINKTGTTSGPVSWVSQLMSVAALFIPLFLIPFAFKIAGGVIGRFHEVATTFNKRGTEAIKGNPNDHNSLRNRTRQKVQDQSLLRREAVYDNLNRRGAIGRFAARRIGGYNLKAATAGMNARVMKEMQEQNDTGDDTEQRALSVNRNMMNANWRARNGVEGVDYRQNDSGGMEYRTLGGAWVGEGAVASAYARWGNSNSAMQWSLGHEMEKASTQEEHDYLASHFGTVAGGPDASWRMTEGQRAGLWKGAAFSKQNIDRQWKHYGVNSDGSVKMGGKEAVSLFREIDEKQGNYAMMQQNADTWTTMSEAMTESKQLVDTGLNAKGESASAEEVDRAREILLRGSRIAHATRSGSMASAPIEDAGGVTTGMRAGGREVGAGAAGRVQEEMSRFVDTSDSTAGVYQLPQAAGSLGKQTAAGPYDNLRNRASDRPRNKSRGPATNDGSGPRNDVNI